MIVHAAESLYWFNTTEPPYLIKGLPISLDSRHTTLSRGLVWSTTYNRSVCFREPTLRTLSNSPNTVIHMLPGAIKRFEVGIKVTLAHHLLGTIVTSAPESSLNRTGNSNPSTTTS